MKIENDVIVGRDGYLFLAGGGHKVYEYISGKLEVPKESIEIFKSNILSRASFCSKNNIKYLHTIAPDKHSVLSRYFPNRNVRSIGRSFLDAADLDNLVFMPDVELKILAKKHQIFRRTDTHLSALGDLFYASMLVKRLTGLSQDDLVEDFLKSSAPQINKASGDLGSKLNPEIFSNEISFSDPPVKHGRWMHNNLTGGNNGIIDLRFNDQPPIIKRVIIFGDSFGRAFSKWLQLFFSEIFFFRTSNFHPEIVEKLNPQIIITQNVERYLPSVISDLDACCFFDYPNLTREPNGPPEDFQNALNKLFNVIL